MTSLQIKCALTAAKYRSITKAASILYISQPVVSKHIASLESELNCSLFDRTHNGIKPTKAGEIFLSCFSSMDELFNQAKSDVNTLEKTVKPLSIALLKGVSLCAIEDVIRDYINKNPDMKIDVSRMSSSDIIHDLINGSLDIGILFDNQTPRYSELKSHALYTSQLVYVLRKGHPLLGQDKLSPKDISPYKYVFSRISDGDLGIPLQMKSYCDKVGMSAERIRWCSDFESIFTTVLFSDDISILDENVTFIRQNNLACKSTGLTHKILAVKNSSNHRTDVVELTHMLEKQFL